ncbi:response regulator transcription factor [Trinickia fusca]|uniref:DNA-binding response regulator n=1 Tax=Trinickia fusca TaxID=2419777 RepID=A0A494XC45_9BURK|nr:response regulator transcription factor [Trinickia fusca]RKP48160.1 DNA-binding response regulator [Trinickia fusca]
MHRVVLVDDHPAMVFALTSILEREPDMKVVGSANDGSEGLKCYRELRPDLLIIDLDIPGLNGFDLIRRVRATDDVVKILVMSSYPPELHAVRCQAVGANGYVSKSEDASHIASAARAAVAGFNCFPAIVNAAAAGESAEGPLAMLTERERAVLRYLAQGRSNKEIGETLSLSNKTISTHKSNILAKLGLTNVVDLAAFAKAHHLI